MKHLIRGEAIKMRSTRTAIGFTIGGAVLMLLVVLLSTLAGDPESVEAKRDAITIAPAGALFVVFGVVGATGEYRHHTLAPAVLIAPDRIRLLLARALAYAITAAAVALVMLIVAFAIGLPLMTEGESLGFGDYAGLLGGGMLAAAFGAIAGVGFGALVGSQVAGVISVLLYLLVLEDLIGLAEEDLLPYTFRVGAAVVAGLDLGDDAFGFAASLAVLAGWAVVLLGAGMARESRREVT